MKSSSLRPAAGNGPGTWIASPGLCRIRGLAGAAGLAALLLTLSSVQAAERTATFAGGCFWCVEADFDKVPGVLETVSGFTGGTLKNPTYNGNHRGHYEAVEITFDDAQVSYGELLKVFWRHIDPLDDGGQFCDRGFSYKTAIFVHDEAQERAAQDSRAEVVSLFPDAEVATVILPAKAFWPVEEYHQNYAEKNPLRYKYYRWNCGRDQRVDALWGDKDWGAAAAAH